MKVRKIKRKKEFFFSKNGIKSKNNFFKRGDATKLGIKIKTWERLF
jgi:hypothetical protein